MRELGEIEMLIPADMFVEKVVIEKSLNLHTHGWCLIEPQVPTEIEHLATCFHHNFGSSFVFHVEPLGVAIEEELNNRNGMLEKLTVNGYMTYYS